MAAPAPVTTAPALPPGATPPTPAPPAALAPPQAPGTVVNPPPLAPAPPEPEDAVRSRPPSKHRDGTEAEVPTEYTPALLVEAQKQFLRYVHSRLGEHVFRVLQEMRTDAEAFARSEKRSAKDTLGQLLGEVEAWRHLPVGEGSTDTVLDQEAEAALRAVPELMKAVESCIVTGAMVLSGAKGTGNEPVSVRIPASRDFLDRVFVRVAKSYTGRGGPSRLARHLTRHKDKLLAEVRDAIDQFLTPYDTVWNAEDEEAVIDIPVVAPEPVAGVAGSNVRTITLDGGPQGSAAGPGPGRAHQATADADASLDADADSEDDDAGSGAGSSASGSGSASDDEADHNDGGVPAPPPKPSALDDDGF